MVASPAPVADFLAWLQRGEPLVQRHQRALKEKSAAQWALGDWLLAMQAQVPVISNPDGYPWFLDTLTLASNHYGYSVVTFQEFRRVASVFPPSARDMAISWKHHQAVAAIAVEPERDAWLFRAKVERWSKTKLQAEMKACREAGISFPLPSAQPRAYPVGLTKSQSTTLAELAKQTGLSLSQLKDLIVSNFLAEPAKVQEFSEAYKCTNTE